jgi:transposase-like protein
MSQQRKAYSPEEKVAIVRKHFLDGEAVSDLCDQHEPNLCLRLLRHSLNLKT